MNKKSVYSAKRLVKDFWLLLKGNRVKFSFWMLAMFAAGLLGYVSIYFLGKIVDFFVKYDSGESLQPFYLYAAGIAAVGIIMTLTRQNAKLSILTLGADIRKKIRIIAMSKLIDLELKWHEKENTGAKIQKISSGGQNIYDAMRMFVNEGMSILTGMGGAFVIFVLLDFKYGLFAIGYLIVFLSLQSYFMKKKAVLQDKLNKINEKLSGKVHESAANILAVKSLGLKENFRNSLESHEDEYYKIWLKNRSLEAKKSMIISIVASLGYGLFIVLLGFDAAKGIIEAATIFVFANYFGRLRESSDMLINSSDRIIELKSGIGRIMSLLDEKTIERESPKLAEVNHNWRRIEFMNVGFRYKDKWVLKNFNLRINRGNKIGIVGRSGSGKSTLAKLILGLYEPQEGEILIDGKPLRDYKQSSINKQIGIVLQDSEMFNLPLAGNIAITDEKPNEEKVAIAARTSELQEMIKRLPQGLKTLIGERGYRLSGGERQRVGIARAVYANFPMLILDEATSHLDSKTETKIRENLDKALENSTLLVIAHRLSTLRDVDKIILMSGGTITEEGTFDELVRKKRHFYELYRTQNRI
ncbi:ABC transporter ATP-binding protein [Candidatus Pacearchaeota archaeon]|nr:ABC transporter ATP-binding protein [Candidatus Pacearchaeota archaeon]